MRPEPAIIMDELAEMANDAWEAYEQAAQWAGPGELTEMLKTIGENRRAMAKTYEAEVERMGHNPRDRDTNTGTGHRLLARLRATFAGERPRALIEECERADTHLAHTLTTIDDMQLSPHMADTLRAHHAEIIAALGQLAATKLRQRG